MNWINRESRNDNSDEEEICSYFAWGRHYTAERYSEVAKAIVENIRD